jgi:hypothetical protein
MKTRDELRDNIIGRVCVCKDYRDWHKKKQNDIDTDWHCHNKTCIWWNICTLKHSIPYTKLDQLSSLMYTRGLCTCDKPKLHEIDGELIKDYFLCVNLDCFKVLREYESIIVEQRLCK